MKVRKVTFFNYDMVINTLEVHILSENGHFQPHISTKV